MVAANNCPYDTDVVADDLFKNPSRMAKFIIKPPEPKNRSVERATGRARRSDPGEMAEKHKGDEGQMGKKDAPKTNARSAPKAIDPNAKDIVKRTGLLGVLGRGGSAGLSTVFGIGRPRRRSEGRRRQHVRPGGGRQLRPRRPRHPRLGQGRRRPGETIGIGAVGTKGRGGGLGGYGTGVGGLGKKGDRDVNVSTGTAVVMGSLDKELIRKVIQEHAAQIRYCYEQQLALNPQLQGKVSIKWVINGGRRGLARRRWTAPATTLEDAQGPRVHDVAHHELAVPEAEGRRHRGHHLPVDPPLVRRRVGRRAVKRTFLALVRRAPRGAARVRARRTPRPAPGGPPRGEVPRRRARLLHRVRGRLPGPARHAHRGPARSSRSAGEAGGSVGRAPRRRERRRRPRHPPLASPLFGARREPARERRLRRLQPLHAPAPTCASRVWGTKDRNDFERFYVYLHGRGGLARRPIPRASSATDDLFVAGGPGIEYFTRLRHFSVGLAADYVYATKAKASGFARLPDGPVHVLAARCATLHAPAPSRALQPRPGVTSRSS